MATQRTLVEPLTLQIESYGDNVGLVVPYVSSLPLHTHTLCSPSCSVLLTTALILLLVGMTRKFYNTQDLAVHGTVAVVEAGRHLEVLMAMAGWLKPVPVQSQGEVHYRGK